MATYRLSLNLYVEGEGNHEQIINWLLDRWVDASVPEGLEMGVSWDDVDWYEVS